ncbi:unnamed protein product [Hermetia illucens]|uniref:Venom allergen-1 n=1 Tax=Hermetia illucens TaxID=343691 RepID=A0A7R8V7L2_HERIL|nr:antigen 5 like allergen Cul n 1-like [Hermetia illucens]CAD7093585.1 unnamed protein product [Hermetia illucens]
MKVQATFLLILASVVIPTEGQNYCTSNLCPSGTTHIACSSNGSFGSQCPANARTVNLSKMKALIVKMHNVRRNRTAGGNLPGFQPATRMRILQWDNELAKIALLNAKRCFMAHDACRNTPRFTHAGQNLAISSTRGMPNRLRRHLIKAIQGWFLEYKDADMDIINSFRDPKTVGHFTLIVSDRVLKLGCGTVRFVKNGRNTLLTACNYSSTNVFDKPVYKTGTAASGCTSGTSPRYKNLCTVNEPLDPNAI